MTIHTPIALIGAGPLGLELAAALKKANLAYTHFEANQVGATMQWWPAGTRWFSSNERICIAGVPLVTPHQEKATREEYLAYLRTVVQEFELKIATYTRVTAISRHGEKEFHITTRKNINGQLLGPEECCIAQKLILATGGTESPNLLNIPGENLPHVSHYFQDPHTYFNRSVLIVGGRNSAVETALRCHKVGTKVHFSYRGSQVNPKDIKYWLYPEFSSLLKSQEITSHFNTTLQEITPTQAILSPPIPNTQYPIPVDFILLLTGYRADMSLCKMAGVTFQPDSDCPIFNAETMETCIPGLYLAGTATAGTQGRPRGYKVFLENCHIHVQRILAHLTHHAAPQNATQYERPES